MPTEAIDRRVGSIRRVHVTLPFIDPIEASYQIAHVEVNRLTRLQRAALRGLLDAFVVGNVRLNDGRPVQNGAGVIRALLECVGEAAEAANGDEPNITTGA